MEVTLEKIEIVKDRTGVDYKEAKETLEETDGSVVDAIINIEERINTSSATSIKMQGESIVDSIKELVKKGNVSKIKVKNSKDETVFNLPVTASFVAAILAPWGVLAGAISSVAFKCKVEVVKDDGSVVEVTDKAADVFEKAKSKGSDTFEKIKSYDGLDKVKDKASDIRDRASDKYDDVRDMVGDKFDDVKYKLDDYKDMAGDKFDSLKGKAEEKIDDIRYRSEDTEE